jgi:hypothetical protein
MQSMTNDEREESARLLAHGARPMRQMERGHRRRGSLFARARIQLPSASRSG